MSATITQTISEYLVLLLDTIRRRWWIAVLAIMCVIPFALIAAQITPVKYTAKSLILLHTDRNNTMPQSRQQILEQVVAIEAWLKSDPIMRELLPQIMDETDLSDPGELSVLLDIARTSIHFELLGGSALEISLDGKAPEGLGQKLEVILARIMEGLSGPNRSILSASQFALLKRSEKVQKEKEALDKAIAQSGAEPAAVIERRLRALQDLNTSIRLDNQPSGKATDKRNGLTGRKHEIEQLISADSDVRTRILQQYETYQTALADHEALQSQISPQSKNYFSVLDASGVVVVGRPQDPVFGNSPKKKIVIAIMFLGCVAAGGLVLLTEFFFPGVRLKNEFEELSGLPVISRFQSKK